LITDEREQCKTLTIPNPLKRKDASERPALHVQQNDERQAIDHAD